MGNYVGLNSVVIYKTLDDNMEYEVKLVDTNNNEKNTVSLKSLLGNALWGSAIGEKLKINSEEPYEIEIIEIKNGVDKNLKRIKELRDNSNHDFKSIFSGINYGTNSSVIYSKFCKTLQWDESQSGKFGMQGQPLYAENADTDRTRDVWFISYLNYYNGDVDNILKNAKFEEIDATKSFSAINFIDIHKKNIVEIITKDKWLNDPKNERITFAKSKESFSYEFLGVFEIESIMNGEGISRRVYRLKSEVYPVDLLE